jgi:hypothetical protein
MLGWARCGFHKKLVGARYDKLLFLHQAGSVGHVVNRGASGPRNGDRLFHASARYVFEKKRFGTRDVELVFFDTLGSVGHIVHSGVSGSETLTYYFSRSGGPGAVSIKSASRHVTLKLCYCIHWDL